MRDNESGANTRLALCLAFVAVFALNMSAVARADTANTGGQQSPAPSTGGQQSPPPPTTGQQSQTPPSSSQGSFYLQNPLSSQFNTVGGLVDGFMQIFSYLAVLFAVFMLIWVGFQFVLAQGKPDRMKELKNWLLYIVIGVAVVIGARIIVSVVINTLQATGTVNQGVITNANNALNGN
ncbi:MAG: hypothetical protein KGI69_01920 [Patescibacteria group bacterium]|nr:hypothetical protein [Patescibacteria group bacterium]